MFISFACRSAARLLGLEKTVLTSHKLPLCTVPETKRVNVCLPQPLVLSRWENATQQPRVFSTHPLPSETTCVYDSVPNCKHLRVLLRFAADALYGRWRHTQASRKTCVVLALLVLVLSHRSYRDNRDTASGCERVCSTVQI